MAFEISITRMFSAAHQIRLYDGSVEPLHGHNWTVRVTVAAEQLDSIGVVMDFHVLERLLGKIIGPWHNHTINEFEPFRQQVNPSAESIAVHIAQMLKLPKRVELKSVEVWETDQDRALYRP